MKADVCLESDGAKCNGAGNSYLFRVRTARAAVRAAGYFIAQPPNLPNMIIIMIANTTAATIFNTSACSVRK
jgi:hypothetical protein